MNEESQFIIRPATAPIGSAVNRLASPTDAPVNLQYSVSASAAIRHGSRKREHPNALPRCTDVPRPHIYWSTLASDRHSSEDRAEVFERGDDLVAVVADGAGGMRGGALASTALVETVRSVAENATLDVHDGDLWAALLKEADAKLSAKMAGETTGVIVVIGPERLIGVSVGDSEAWIVRGDSIDDLTRSQERSRLGSGRAVPVDFQRRRLDGVLLIATDGLFKYASPKRIAATVREGEVSRVAERLTALVRLPSGRFQDDLGIIVVARR
jgi:serine/threonine protein phosphatase PrpC